MPIPLKPDDARTAAMHLRWAADYLRDHALMVGFGVGKDSMCIPLAEENIRSALAALGFDLVPRQSDQAAHEAAIARRVAEDRDFGQQDIVMGR